MPKGLTSNWECGKISKYNYRSITSRNITSYISKTYTKITEVNLSVFVYRLLRAYIPSTLIQKITTFTWICYFPTYTLTPMSIFMLQVRICCPIWHSATLCCRQYSVRLPHPSRHKYPAELVGTSSWSHNCGLSHTISVRSVSSTALGACYQPHIPVAGIASRLVWAAACASERDSACSTSSLWLPLFYTISIFCRPKLSWASHRVIHARCSWALWWCRKTIRYALYTGHPNKQTWVSCRLKVLYRLKSICKQTCKHLLNSRLYFWMYLLIFGQSHP